MTTVMATLRQRRSDRALKLCAWMAASGLALVGASAQAEDYSSVAPAFGNTVISRYPDGTSQKIWLHPDGSWDGVSRKGVRIAGHWSVRGEKVCLRQSTPPTLPIAYCTPFPPRSEPGVQWTSRDVAGRPITLSLMRGVPPEYQSGQTSTH